MTKFWYSSQLTYVFKRIIYLPLMIMLMQLFGASGSYFGTKFKCALISNNINQKN